jgi:hypothetical protein
MQSITFSDVTSYSGRLLFAYFPGIFFDPKDETSWSSTGLRGVTFQMTVLFVPQVQKIKNLTN